MRAPRRLAVLLVLPLAGGGSSLAQQSTSFSATEYVFNAGGHPSDGVILTSPSYRISLDALGEGLVATSLTSASFQMGAGFSTPYPPPTEVTGLRFASDTLLVWSPESSAGLYQIYRNTLPTLPGGFGACFQPDVATPSASDTSTPSIGAGNFYLVTVRNLLDEEGTKGYRSSGAERANPAPCP